MRYSRANNFSIFFLFIFVFILLFRVSLRAEKSLVSKPNELIKPDSDLNFDKTKLDLTAEFRNSGVGGRTSPRLLGFNLGLKIHARNRIGFGFYTLSSTAKKYVGMFANGDYVPMTDGRFDQTPTIQPIRELFFYYGNFAYSHYFVQNKFFEIQTPLEIGFGQYHVKFADEGSSQFPLINQQASITEQNTAAAFIQNPKFLERKSTFMPISIGTTVSLKLHEFVWPFFNFGYRFVVNAPEFSNDFNGFFYNFGLSIDFVLIGKKAEKAWRNR